MTEGLRRGVEAGRRQGKEEGIAEGIETGHQTGLAEGRKVGIEEGIAQGKEAGIRQGRLEGLQVGQLNIVRRLLSRRFGELDAAVNAKLQKLSITQLESLAESAWDFITDDELVEWLDKQP
ncbi:MAG: DUF4351 domain-containing protein [Spirulinaceae cyanobacterium RM2_2_10]|nr:DUF4351 domain-containing protein [Spirulinaceae cyanobacterium RM2_2_10]